MKIAAILRALPGATGRGGVSYQVHELCERLAQRGHQVVVFSADPAPPGAPYQVRQIEASARLKGRRHFFYLGFARRIACQDFSGFDLVHAHGDDHFLGRRPAPVVRTFWGSDLGEALGNLRPGPLSGHLLGYALELLSAARAERTVAIAENTRRYLPFVRDVVSPGVDLERFRPGLAKSPFPSVLFVAGTLAGRKRGRLLLEAFARHVRPRHPDAELWLVCPEPAAGEGVRHFATFPASPAGVGELARLYQQAWIFCLPSSYEGFGVPYVEAMACGTTVVATPNPGAREVLAGGRYGILAAPDELGPALARAIAQPELRLRLEREGCERARDFGWDGVVGRYEQIFAEEIAAWRRRRGGRGA